MDKALILVLIWCCVFYSTFSVCQSSQTTRLNMSPFRRDEVYTRFRRTQDCLENEECRDILKTYLKNRPQKKNIVILYEKLNSNIDEERLESEVDKVDEIQYPADGSLQQKIANIKVQCYKQLRYVFGDFISYLISISN